MRAMVAKNVIPNLTTASRLAMAVAGVVTVVAATRNTVTAVKMMTTTTMVTSMGSTTSATMMSRMESKESILEIVQGIRLSSPGISFHFDSF